MESSDLPIFSVSDFVAILNQTMEYAYPSVTVNGELANFRISKNRWVYFDLKDDNASVRCFGTVYQLPGPLEDGMILNVRAVPRLHQLYGFSLNIQNLQPAGEGSIRKAADLVAAKLAAEGLFDIERKRPLPYPPAHIGLVTSGESAAYADFTKILQARWGGVAVTHVDVQVQGEAAPAQIIGAIRQLNGLAEPPEVIIIIRGGGSADDLQAFSDERVTREVAASRVPTLVAIGHEVDVSLAELAADQRASTPSNAAELLVPDKTQVLAGLLGARRQLAQALVQLTERQQQRLHDSRQDLAELIIRKLERERRTLDGRRELLAVLDPEAVLRRGYAVVRRDGTTIRRAGELQADATIVLTFQDGTVTAITTKKK